MESQNLLFLTIYSIYFSDQRGNYYLRFSNKVSGCLGKLLGAPLLRIFFGFQKLFTNEYRTIFDWDMHGQKCKEILFLASCNTRGNFMYSIGGTFKVIQIAWTLMRLFPRKLHICNIHTIGYLQAP